MLLSESKGMAGAQGHLTFSFDDFVLDADRGSLSKDGMEIPLRPKSFDVLTYLVRHQGVLVSKSDLMGAVWPDVVVTEDSMTQCLIEIRKALADRSKTMIRTLPRRGYLFELPVKIHEPAFDAPGANLTKGLLSRRRPSAWSAAAIMLLAVAMVVTLWSTVPEPSSVVRVSEARQHYIKGRFFHDRRSAGDLNRAIAQYEQALSIDPDLADALVGLAGSIYVRAYENGGGLEAVGADYFAYLMRALDNEPDHAEAHMRMACYQMHFGSPEVVQQHLNQAIKHGQNSPLVMSMSAGILMDQLRLEEAIALQKRAVELDPLGAVNRGNLAHMLQRAGRHHESKKEFLIALDLNSDPSSLSLTGLADAYILLHQPEEAEALMQQLPVGPGKDRIQALLSQSSGDVKETQRIIEQLALMEGVEPVFFLAEIYAFRNLEDIAFHWLMVATNRQLAVGDADKTERWFWDSMGSPFLALLHEDARWEEWQSFMNLHVPDWPTLELAQNLRDF